MTTLQYKPLDRSKNEIRLIKLLPRFANGVRQSELPPKCDIFHVSLDEGLSYTWGDPQDTQVITVGSTRTLVTRNLYSAIDHLRLDEAVKVIWIDALCINQSDNEEKGWQVQLMRKIYQRASWVSVWLGPADETSDAVMDFLQSFGGKAKNFGLDSGPEPVRTHWRKLASQSPSIYNHSRCVKSVNIPGGTIEFALGDLNKLYYSVSGSHEKGHLFPLSGMAALFTRPWWGRTWVLQEISLAQKANFICGSKKISRRSCCAALNAFCALRPLL
jgi:hypothetical protein